MAQFPRWATAMMARHPEEAVPTRKDPIPAWLEAEVEAVPLWYIIREADGVRTQHPFLLYEEIIRQPGKWDEVLSTMGPKIGAVAARIVGAGIKRVIVTGCGSAFFTSIHDEFTIPRLAGLPTQAIESFELLHYFPDVDPASTLVIAHSGTGGSIETIEALQSAHDLGCLTLAISNTEDSPIVKVADMALVYTTHQACGPCISVVSTRILMATMLAEAIARTAGRTDLPAVGDSLKDVPEVSREFIANQEPLIRELARTYKGLESVLIVGSGANYFSAREGTLKVEEQSVLVGKAYRTGDFHHAALAVVGPNKLVIGIEIGGDANERMEDVLLAAKEAGSPTIAVTWSGTAGADALAGIADHEIRLSGGLPEILVPIAMTPVFQLLGYYLGVERGFNPDTLRSDYLPNARAWLVAFPLGTH